MKRSMRKFNICLIGIPEREEKCGYHISRGEKFPELIEDNNLQIQEA